MNAQASALTLADLPRGSRCLVASVEMNGLIKRRILDLGMVPGTPVDCLRTAPSGDPTAYLVRGSVIALRRQDANNIRVYQIMR